MNALLEIGKWIGLGSLLTSGAVTILVRYLPPKTLYNVWGKLAFKTCRFLSITGSKYLGKKRWRKIEQNWLKDSLIVICDATKKEGIKGLDSDNGEQ